VVTGQVQQDINQDPNGAAFGQTSIAMKNTLGMAEFVEGVKTRPQLDFLRRHGCRTFQCYLFSRPVPLAKFEKNFETDI